MTAAGTLARGRKRAEALMVDVGELRGPDVKGPLDEDTNQYTYAPGPLKYAGKGKLQTTDAIGNDKVAGDRAIMVTRFEVHLPMSAPEALVDDVWTFTASAHDPQMVGKRFRVATPPHKTFFTARRIAVEEVQS